MSFKNVEWDNFGINITGEMLNHLRYADDVVVIFDNINNLKNVIETLNVESQKIGFKINIDETKKLSNTKNIVVDEKLE